MGWSHPRSIECFNIITKLFRLAVDQFTSSGLDALGQKLGRLDMARAADISRQACAGPNSLVLALLYLERLRRRNPDYLSTVSSADLPSTPGTYSMPVYRDRPDTVTNHGPALPSLLSEAWRGAEA